MWIEWETNAVNLEKVDRIEFTRRQTIFKGMPFEMHGVRLYSNGFTMHIEAPVEITPDLQHWNIAKEIIDAVVDYLGDRYLIPLKG